MTTAPQPAWLRAALAPITRAITTIAVHCTATQEGRSFSVADIRRWHLANGWSDIGYHFVVALDGSIEVGRPKAQAGAHVAGHNAKSIGIVYVGGLDRSAKPKDTRTPAQKAAMLDLLRALKTAHTAAIIQGHRDYSPDLNGNGKIEPFEWMKACPCFDAKAEYAGLRA